MPVGDLLGEPPSELGPPPGYKPGTIKSIKLINFMCHESFELPLGPNVNFIIGPNGSGKSALLTALTVALGGRATTTSRAKKASDFIKYGASYAKVSVVLHNYDKLMDIQQAFKPAEYGKSITVEKTIYKDDASKLALKSDKDKKVSERKHELDDMLDHFGILINNPICILNQEVSKSFLHSKRPEDKFDLFMKATNLEQIEQDYESARSSHKEWNQCISRKNVAFSLLDQEYKSCKEKTYYVESRMKMIDQQLDLEMELIFALVREKKAINKQLDQKLAKLNETIEKVEVEISKRQEKIKNYELDIQVYKTKIQSTNENYEEARKKLNDIRSKESSNKSKQIDIRTKIDTINRRVARTTDDMNSLEKSIEDKKKELKEQDDLDTDNEVRKSEIEKLEREVPALYAREKSIRLHTHQLEMSMTSVRGDLNAANMRVSELRNKQLSANGQLNRFKAAQGNTLRRYGDHVMKIHQEIDREYNNGRFKEKPIGPLGYYLKLKTPDLAGPLEIHLGRNAHAFACDNNQDMTMLSSIFKRLGAQSREFRHPMIITRPFGPKHDSSKFKACHDTYKCFLDHLEIEEPVVYNALIDRTMLESILFIPDYQQAEALMIDQHSVPRNTRMAYTKDCSVMHPRTNQGGYRSYANRGRTNLVLFECNNQHRINEMQQELELINAQLREAENLAQKVKETHAVQRKEYDNNNLEIRKLMDEMRKKEEQLLNLKTTINVQPEELSALETELVNANKAIAVDKLALERLNETLDSLKSDLDDIIREKKGITDLMALHEQNRNADLKVIESTKNSINEYHSFIRQKQVILKSHEEERVDLSKQIEEELRRLAKLTEKLPENYEKPTKNRSSEEIDEQLKKLKAYIQADDNQDPHEVLATLRKRMGEIEDLKHLKDMNSSNFSVATRTLDARKAGFAALRNVTISAVGTTFTLVMRSMKMNGILQVNLEDVKKGGEIVKKARTLDMRIETDYTPTQKASLVMNESDANNNTGRRRISSRSQPAAVDLTPSRPKRARMNGNGTAPMSAEKENGLKMTDCRSLSGGERSFSTVSFVLALWHHCQSPFKLMDEIDVFMDMVTRRVSYNALIRFAQCAEECGQFLFFSPLELPKIDNAGQYVRVFEMPAIIRKRPFSQVAGDQPEEG